MSGNAMAVCLTVGCGVAWYIDYDEPQCDHYAEDDFEAFPFDLGVVECKRCDGSRYVGDDECPDCHEARPELIHGEQQEEVL